MTKILSFHSFRRGTGKSCIVANASSILAMRGYRVGVIDTSLFSPSMHVLFGLSETKIKFSLNDYLWDTCTLEQTVHDVTSHLQPGVDIDGQVFLIPASSMIVDITRVLREGFPPEKLTNSFRQYSQLLNLDYLLVDTYTGLSDATLLSIAISDIAAIILRLDEQNYHGTGILVDLAREFEISKVTMIVNEIPDIFDLLEVKKQVEMNYNCPVVALLPYSDEMMSLSSSGIFVLQYPWHALTLALNNLTLALVS